MLSCVWRAGSAAMAISLCAPATSMLATGAVAIGPTFQLAQNVADPGRGAAEPSPSPGTDAPALPANSPEQIRKAQIELRRLECLRGRVDGKLGEQTRQAVQKFWASAKQPAVEVNITDELISDLAARGDLFCRPVRPFFGFGGGRNATRPPFLPGARPIPAPAAATPPAPAAEH
jgi:peptidoglycan hydrolase-like protein with peptidoglycan-binding domain